MKRKSVKAPYGKKQSKKGKFQSTAKKSLSIVRKSMLSCNNICPDTMRVVLPYILVGELGGGGVSTADSDVIHGNGANDPEVAIGGLQPMGFDQWASFYDRYRVISSRIEVEGFPTVTGVGCFLGVGPQTNAAKLFNREQLSELPYSKEYLIGVSGDAQKTIKSSITTAQIRGVLDSTVKNDDSYSAQVTSLPQREWFWHIFGYAIGTNSTNFSIQYVAKIYYTLEFFDRKSLARS